jgi:hypothetical protein
MNKKSAFTAVAKLFQNMVNKTVRIDTNMPLVERFFKEEEE